MISNFLDKIWVRNLGGYIFFGFYPLSLFLVFLSEYRRQEKLEGGEE